MAKYPQELAQDAVCQSHTGHMTGLWFLPARPLRLNTNERNEFYMHDVVTLIFEPLLPHSPISISLLAMTLCETLSTSKHNQ